MENYTFEKYMYRFVYDRKKENKEENLIQLEIYNPFYANGPEFKPRDSTLYLVEYLYVTLYYIKSTIRWTT